MSETNTVSPLRSVMIEDMAARSSPPPPAQPHLQLQAVCRLAQRSPDTATPDEVRRFQLPPHRERSSICNRNRS